MQASDEVADSPPLLILHRELAEEKGLAAALAPSDSVEASAAFGELVAAGPRASDPVGYAIVIEAIREGYLLHYGKPRLFPASIDRDLALLAGDFLYALGLERLSLLGDIDAVGELADLISLAAVIHADGPTEDPASAALIRSLWLATSVAVATGGDSEFTALKAEIPACSDAFPLSERFLAWADARADASGVGEAWARGREQVGFDS